MSNENTPETTSKKPFEDAVENTQPSYALKWCMRYVKWRTSLISVVAHLALCRLQNSRLV